MCGLIVVGGWVGENLLVRTGGEELSMKGGERNKG